MPKSTYYWMLDHPETERTDPHEEDVGRVWRDSGRVYGAGRIVCVQLVVAGLVTMIFRV